ncbi:unnamed protein product, partial [Mesorhabditis belari]|uniref:Tetratricopeptide repeat protein n=1 Tax=Mesorhabditis belari TaxID=2138241 RepID=A0AAF3FDP7_9BILA
MSGCSSFSTASSSSCSSHSPTPSTANECDSFDMKMASIDTLIDDYEGEEAFKRLTEIQPTVDDNRWVAFSYRFAQACYIRFNQWSEEKKQAERLELIRRGLEAVERAYQLDKDHFDVLTQCAVLTGTLAENSGVKDKVKLGFQCKVYLDAALVKNPNHFALLHMRGRFLLQLAELSWVEKKAARVLFGKLPEASYDLALEDLLKADSNLPSAIDNLLYIGKSYKGKGDKKKAREYLNKVIALNAEDAVDAEQIAEAKLLLTKL